jgi:hypothetical protein
MVHLHTARTRFERTPPEWLPVGGQLGELANAWSGRGDIVAFVGEGAGQGAAACFVPALAEMEVNVTAAFGEGCDPRYIHDLTDRDNQFDHPAAMGAVVHEAMHAKHSTANLQEQADEVRDPFEFMLLTDLEETRIEARGVEQMPENRSFLRACALKLVLGDLREDKDFTKRGLQSLSKLMLLSLARVDAGVLEPEDVKVVAEAAERMFGEELVGKLREVWLRGQAHRADADWRSMHKLALRWIELLEEAGHDPRKESEAPEWLKELLKALMGEPRGGPGEEEGEGGGGEPGEGQPAGGILVEMAGETEAKARDEANAQARRESDKRVADRNNEGAEEKAQHEKQARDCFGRGQGPGPANTRSTLLSRRPPTEEEHAAAIALSKALERAKYRDRVTVKATSKAPPGRLRMRSAVAASAEKARGAMSAQEPWTRKRRLHSVDPDLKVGMMVDISGSMRKAMEPMAVAAWVVSEAIRRVQGTAASIYFGNDIFPVLAPGEHLDEVRVYSASDMTEKFDKGFRALNGALDLLGSDGARLLVVVSDLHHKGEEIRKEEEWFRRCRAAGVGVVVVSPEEGQLRNVEARLMGNGTSVTLDAGDVTAVARLVGEAAVRELEKASR